MYHPIKIDRERLTIMDVVFPDLETVNSVADALGSNMFEGFEPTKNFVELYRDYSCGKIPENALIPMLQNLYEK
jgi:putative transcriptional regulator